MGGRNADPHSQYPIPWLGCDEDTIEFELPEERNSVSALDFDQAHELATKFIAEKFLAMYELDSGAVSEWLAKNNDVYKNLEDEDTIDDTLDVFFDAIDVEVATRLGVVA